MQVNQDEITVGLVAQLDTSMLRTLGGCLTNAEQGVDGDRAVGGACDFLIVGVDALSGLCTAVPLFAKSAVGNQPLITSKKSGHWIDADSFFSHWQHWRIPLAAVVAASTGDAETPETRRRYALHDRTALDEIRSWEKRNRAAYRPA